MGVAHTAVGGLVWGWSDGFTIGVMRNYYCIIIINIKIADYDNKYDNNFYEQA
jgi:hypothetical protein